MTVILDLFFIGNKKSKLKYSNDFSSSKPQLKPILRMRFLLKKI